MVRIAKIIQSQRESSPRRALFCRSCVIFSLLGLLFSLSRREDPTRSFFCSPVGHVRFLPRAFLLIPPSCESLPFVSPPTQTHRDRRPRCLCLCLSLALLNICKNPVCSFKPPPPHTHIRSHPLCIARHRVHMQKNTNCLQAWLLSPSSLPRLASSPTLTPTF